MLYDSKKQQIHPTHVVPIPSPVVSDESNNESELENELDSCGELERETKEEVKLKELKLKEMKVQSETKGVKELSWMSHRVIRF